MHTGAVKGKRLEHAAGLCVAGGGPVAVHTDGEQLAQSYLRSLQPSAARTKRAAAAPPPRRRCFLDGSVQKLKRCRRHKANVPDSPWFFSSSGRCIYLQRCLASSLLLIVCQPRTGSLAAPAPSRRLLAQRRRTAGSSNQERRSSSRPEGANPSLQEVGPPLSYKYNLIICCSRNIIPLTQW